MSLDKIKPYAIDSCIDSDTCTEVALRVYNKARLDAESQITTVLLDISDWYYESFVFQAYSDAGLPPPKIIYTTTYIALGY